MSEVASEGKVSEFEPPASHRRPKSDRDQGINDALNALHEAQFERFDELLEILSMALAHLSPLTHARQDSDPMTDAQRIVASRVREDICRAIELAAMTRICSYEDADAHLRRGVAR